jgi:imidazolonepropionase-like amidohydrolase
LEAINRKNLLIILAIFCALNFSWLLNAQDHVIAIKANKILTITKGVLVDGIILVQKGKIQAVGKNLEIPRDAEIIHIENSVVMPGIIDAATTIGIDNKDLAERLDPIVPHLRVIDSFNPYGMKGSEPDPSFEEAIRGGVTTVFLCPGNNINVIAGQGAVVKLAGKSLQDQIVKEPAGMVINLGDTPKDTYSEMKRMPTTRMGIMALLRETFRQAQNYATKSAGQDSKMEALVKVLRQEIPARVHANRLEDVMAAIQFAEEFNLKLVLDHCVEGYKVADLIAKNKIPVVVYNNFLAPSIYAETKGFTEEYAGILSSQGVKVAFQSDSVVGAKILKFARVNAAIYASYGMKEEEALKGLTIYAAEILGVSDRIGSIEAGKDADLVVLDGDPFDIFTSIKAVLIDGKIVFRESKE